MSDPKRYAIRGFSAALVEEDNGVFVRYEDYARLKAEVERLTKAGDTMADAYLEEYRFNTLMIPPIIPDEIEAWNAAKEGKPQP